MIDWANNKVKNMDAWDIGLTKLTVAAAVLFIITTWDAAMTWVHSVNTWYFFIAFIVFGIRPFYRFFLKK